jgi:hypothetical protein
LNISAAAVAKLWRSRVTRPRLIQSVTSGHQPTNRITAAENPLVEQLGARQVAIISPDENRPPDEFIAASFGLGITLACILWGLPSSGQPMADPKTGGI